MTPNPNKMLLPVGVIKFTTYNRNKLFYDMQVQ